MTHPRQYQPPVTTRVSRREALAAWATVLATGAVAGAAPHGSRLRLGLVTYTWGQDWDLPTLIANCTRAGIAGVELRTTHAHGVEPTLDARQRAEVRSRFADSPVTLVGLGSTCEYHSPDPVVIARHVAETARFVKLCHDVGGSGVKVRPNALPADAPEERTLEQIGRCLHEVSRHAADHGVQIRLEVHGRGTSELPRIKRIMEVADHPNCVLCWNCNGEDLAGAGFAANYEMVERWMGTVHIHDLRRVDYPWADLFARLRMCTAPGFTGWTLIEEAVRPDDIVAALQENRSLWDKLAAG